MLEVGTKAPEFSLPDQNGNVHTLEEYRGKKVILYFYPKDNTPGCSKQACGFGELYPQFVEKGAVVLGVSKDSVASHKRFEEKMCIRDRKCHQLFDDFIVALADIISHAGAHMIGKEHLVEAVQRCVDGGHLHEDVSAVGVIFQHVLNAAHLALDAFQAVHQVAPFLVGALLCLCVCVTAAATDFFLRCCRGLYLFTHSMMAPY